MFRKRQPAACTTKSGCLTILNQRGGTKPPAEPGPGLGPGAGSRRRHGLVGLPGLQDPDGPGRRNSFKDLEAAENTAAKQKGVVAISNSYGGGQGKNNAAYNHPGIAITASTGDGGYAPANLYPASDTNVVAVGGTAIVAKDTASAATRVGLVRRRLRLLHEERPAEVAAGRQDDLQDRRHGRRLRSGSTRRTVGSDHHQRSHAIVGGTSESSPMIAAVFALSGNTKGYPAQYVYANTKNLYDITSRQQRQLRLAALRRRQGLGRSDRPRHPERDRRFLSRPFAELTLSS